MKIHKVTKIYLECDGFPSTCYEQIRVFSEAPSVFIKHIMEHGWTVRKETETGEDVFLCDECSLRLHNTPGKCNNGEYD